MSLVFGKYEKIRRIAQGGMGEVFLSRQTGVLDRLAILKSLRQDLASEREFVEQFLDEARVAATLNHPNIVSIYDVGEWPPQNGTYYIAMEYVPGEDLSKLWYAAAKAGVGLPFQVSVRICFEAALGLDHAHKAKDVRGSPLNIVHRDVSPQNIMVRGDGVVKLVDFGIAKAANKSSRTQTGMVKGKLQYMSPEQVRGEALDGRSDQFSLGVVLWEMCTGRRLFKADTEINTLQKILQSPIPKPAEHVPGFPPELESTILKMLQRDSEKRFRHLGEVANELKGYLDRASLSAGETTVAGFVQQILGKELEERIRDLTPMEPTEHAAPMPQPKDRSSNKQRAVTSTGMKAAANDGPTAVVSEDDIGRMATGPKGEWAVRKVDGKVMHFGEMSTLHQWILDGAVVGDDTFSTDGKNWKKLSSAAQFAKFLEIASAAQQVAQQGPLFAAQGAAGPAQAPSTSLKTVTRPLVPADPTNPNTLALNTASQQAQGAKDPGTEFSLGDLPASKTGTWGAPEIAMVVAAAREREAAGKRMEPGSDGLTPTTRANDASSLELGRPPPTRQAARVPTIVWLLGGIIVALAAVVGSLAAFEPDLLLAVVGNAPTDNETLKALSAAKTDDPQAIDALLKSAEPAAQAPKPTPDVLAAAAILHVAKARVDDETDRIFAMLLEQNTDPKAPFADPKPATDAQGHLDAAYKLATSALSPEKGPKGSAAAQLAMAKFHAEKGALPELDTDAEAALAAAKGSPFEATATAELAAVRALVDGRKSLAVGDAAVVRAAADKLSSVDDPRARIVVALLHAHAAVDALASPNGADEAKADVAKLKEDARALSENTAGDPRPALLGKLAKRLEKRLDEKPVKNPASGGVDAGPVASNNANTNANNGNANANANNGNANAAVKNGNAGAADAGVAQPPPEPETFESAMDKAKRAQKRGSAKEAAKWAKKALELKPGVVEAQLVLGFAYIDGGVPGSARQVFQQVLSKEGSNCAASFGLAKANEDDGKTTDARNQYLHFVEICPTDKDAELAKTAAAKLE